MAMILALVLVVPVLAGGWAVITLDKLPGEAQAGEPLSIGFTVRQHGRTPMVGLTPTISARLSGSNKVVAVSAAENGAGHYTAILTLPESGQWEWSIQAFSMNQPMPALVVLPGSGQKTANAPDPAPFPVWAVITAFVLAAGLMVSGIFFRKNTRMAAPLLIAGLALGLFGFVAYGGQAAPQAKALAAPNLTPAELGRQLFLAKGCTTCHVREGIERTKETSYADAGPSLTRLPRPDPDFLRGWLADPASIKPGTEMPNLKLGADEIEQLIAFLISDQ